MPPMTHPRIYIAGLYNGTDRTLAPGSLLAIPPAVAATIKVTTVPGAQLKQALTDYGGYIVDDTGSQRGGAAICMEPGAAAELKKQYGFDLKITDHVTPTGQGALLYADMLAIYQALAVVTNNSPATIGGGGTPRAPLAPPICDADVPHSIVEGTLHKVESCAQCGSALPNFCQLLPLRSGSDVIKSFYVSTTLTQWGCEKVSKGASTIIDTSTTPNTVYVLESNPLVSQ